MSRVLDPHTDTSTYEQIQRLVGITSTPAEIDASPLFWSAESEVLAQLPAAALPDGRSHPARDDIEIATVFFAVANYVLALEDSETDKTKVVKSETIGATRREYVIAASASLSKEDKSAWFETQARKILAPLGSTPVDTEAIATVNIKETF